MTKSICIVFGFWYDLRYPWYIHIDVPNRQYYLIALTINITNIKEYMRQIVEK
jgi:hypothetical protein